MKSEISVCAAIMLNDHSNADNIEYYRTLRYKFTMHFQAPCPQIIIHTMPYPMLYISFLHSECVRDL